MHEQQDIEFSRVADKIGAIILRFFSSRLAQGLPEFRAEQLHAYVSREHKTAPDSANRIMRSLRQGLAVDYLVVSRRESRYRILSVGQRVAA